MSTALAKYDAARKALAAAHRVDEVKCIRDKAAAMALYARQAKDGELIALAMEIRKRAERRLGELMEEERKAGRLATGKEGKRKALGSPKDPRDRPSLAAQGVGKALADRARKAAAMPEEKFEAHVAQAVRVAVAAAEGDREGRKQPRRRTKKQKEPPELAAETAPAEPQTGGEIFSDDPAASAERMNALYVAAEKEAEFPRKGKKRNVVELERDVSDLPRDSVEPEDKSPTVTEWVAAITLLIQARLDASCLHNLKEARPPFGPRAFHHLAYLLVDIDRRWLREARRAARDKKLDGAGSAVGLQKHTDRGDTGDAQYK